MKIGKISSFGTLKSQGKWYQGDALYPINRIYCVHSGKAEFSDGEKTYVFEKGKVYFVPESGGFAPVADKDELFVHSYADFALISPITCRHVIFADIKADASMRLAIDVFLHGCERKNMLKEDSSASASALYSMIESAVSYLFTRVAEANDVDFVSDSTVTHAIYIMNRKMNENLTVADLAREVYMSEDGFIRRFSRVMGTTPYAYLKRLRLTTAMSMINDGENIARAAVAVGYSDAASLLHAISMEKRK